ncbi:MAG: PQQ-binding-like beta-propeller repeat protein [Deltaproteobacteria bacterium]|nr:PQQ-binding-like beta-propeller repeat protein [Deltaproteobacteria bacterium]
MPPLARLCALLACALAASSSLPSQATACSCAFRLSRQLSPADGAEGLPLDARIFVFLKGPFLPEVIEGSAGEYRLRDAEGRAVPLRTQRLLNRLALVPTGDLRPDSRYVLEQRFVRLPEGELPRELTRWQTGGEARLWKDRARGLLSDEGRHHLLLHRLRSPEAQAVRSEPSWLPVARFRTGSARETGEPRAPRGMLAEYGYRYGGGDCGPGTSIGVEFSPAGPARVFELHQRGRGPVATFALSGARRLCRPGEKPAYPDGCGWEPKKRIQGLERFAVFAGDQHCFAPKVHFRRDGRYALQLVSVSASGRQSPIDAQGWIEATLRAERRRPPPAEAARPEQPAPGPRTHAMLVHGARLWVASSEGLFERDLRSGRVLRQYTSRDGLPDDVVLSVAGRGGRLWALSLSGPAYLHAGRFAPVQARKPDPPGSEPERQWRAVLGFDRRVFNATSALPASPRAWRELLEGAERLFCAVDADGILWLGRAGFPGVLMRCDTGGCTRLPAWDTGGPSGRWLGLLRAGPEGDIWARSQDFWILDRPRGSEPVPDRALPRGPSGCFVSPVEGVLQRSRGRFRQRRVPGLGQHEQILDMQPISRDRAWVLAADRASEKGARVLLADLAGGRVTVERTLPASPQAYPPPAPGAFQWAAAAEQVWVKIGDRLWRASAEGVRELSGGQLPPVVSVTAMSPGKAGALWLASDRGLYELRGGEVKRRLGWEARPLDREADLRIELRIPEPFPGRVRLLRRGALAALGWELARDAEGKQMESGAGRLPEAELVRFLEEIERQGAFRLPSPPFYFQNQGLFFRLDLELGARRHDFRIFALGDGEPPAYARIVQGLLALREKVSPLGARDAARRLLEEAPAEGKAPAGARPRAEPQEKAEPAKPAEQELVTAVALPAKPPPETARLDLRAAPPPRCDESRIVDVPRHDWLFAAPHIGIGMRILATESTVYFSAHRFVYALDARTGQVRWRHDLYDAHTEGPPALVGDVLLVGANGHTALVALDAGSGERLWSLPHPPRKPEMIQFSSFLPTIAAGAGGRAWSLRFDGIRILDVRSGKPLVELPGRYSSRHYLVTRQGTLLAVHHGKVQGLVEFDAGGRVLRHLDLGQDEIREPGLAWSGLLPSGPRVVIATESYPEGETFIQVISKSARSRILVGTGRWAGSLAVTEDGTLLLSGRGRNMEAQLLALELVSGPSRSPARVLWQRSEKLGGPVAASGKRLYLHTDNRIHELDPRTGCTLRRYGDGGYEPYALSYAQPVQAAGERLFTVTQNGKVVAFSLGK